MRTELRVAEGGLGAGIQLGLLLGYASVSQFFGHRGLYRLARTLGAVFSKRNSAVLVQGSRQYKVYLNDGYYAHLLQQGFAYEREVETALRRVLSEKTLFLDCGANNGYWSVYAASKSARVVAVEATSGPLARLEENNRLNNHAFQLMRRAIYSKSDTVVEFAIHPDHHAENTVTGWVGGWAADPHSQHEAAQTITIDDACDAALRGAEADRIIVKIDVEGAEIEAFQGAWKTLDRGALFVYEDHGLDPSCRNTEFVLHSLHLPVYLLQEGTEPIQIEGVDQLRRLKTRPKIGYNLITANPGSPVLEKALRPD